MPRTAYISEQGPRLRMEDTHVLIPDFTAPGWILGAVFDGHRGSRAASYAASHFPELVQKAINSGQVEGNALVFALESLGHDLLSEPSGCTAAVFLLQDTELAVANVGDARVVIIRNGKAWQLTRDHRVDNEDERQRILDAGGIIEGSYVMHGLSGLMPTRSLGDAGFQEVGVTFSPFVQTVQRSNTDEWLITACDGLFDTMSNQEVANTIGDALIAEEAVDRLRHEVLDIRQGTDNLTILAVDLR
ncbi:MAG: PP2C family protein-serine/threonine phosphatase [Desulfovermiculus sp.]|nr:PP2C family protein-serine/threonine phosphatase [Desulfovermiculus sp.]